MNLTSHSLKRHRLVGVNTSNSFLSPLTTLQRLVVSLISPEEVSTLQVLTVSGERMTVGVRSTWANEVHLVNRYAFLVDDN